MARWEEDVLKDISYDTFYNFTVDQPVDTKFGRFKATSFVYTEGCPLVHLRTDDGQSGWYNAFEGVWIDDPLATNYQKYDCSDATHALWLRLIRSFLEEKLDPKEIVQAEKLEPEGYKLVHRYTGGWSWIKLQEEAPKSGEERDFFDSLVNG